MMEHLDMAIAFAVVMLAVSLLVTIFVQLVSALFGLRGSNLLWGIQQLLVTACPGICDDLAEREKQAAAIAEGVLTHPLISDSSVSRFKALTKVPLIGRLIKRMQLARAIRLEELVRVLNTVKIESTVAKAALAGAAGHAGAELNDAVARAAAELTNAEATVRRKLTAAQHDIEAWFQTAMDRVSQRFALHVRAWTVAFSIVIAFALHLDTFRILSQLAANPDLRAQVASASTALQQVAAARLNTTTSGSQLGFDPKAVHPPQLYRDAMTRLNLPGVSVPGAFGDRPAAVEWLRTTLSNQGKTSDDIDKVVAAYEQDVQQNLTSEIDRLTDSALSVRGIVSGTGFQLVPAPYHSWDIAPWWPAPATLQSVAHPTNLHFWGILFSAGLLSLGAPFWYNALKTLSALKPVVASKEEKKEEQKEQ